MQHGGRGTGTSEAPAPAPPVARAASASRRAAQLRGVIRGLVIALALVLSLPLAVVSFVGLLPRTRAPFTHAALVVTAYTTACLLAGGIALGLGLLAVRLGARRSGRVAATLALIALVLFSVPLARLWQAARSQGVALSPRDNLSVAVNTGEPDARRSVVYAVVGDQELRLDVWLPPGRADVPRPAVVWVHGGGWVGGTRGMTPMWNAWLNERGYAVFDIDYRLAPPPRWDQAAADVRCAVGWVKTRAASYGVDPRRIVLAGGSAGGNLALAVAYEANNDGTASPGCPVGDTSVAAVFAIHPITDAAAWWESDVPGARYFTEGYTGSSPAASADRYAAISPLSAVRPGLPPTLLVHGTADRIVPHSQSVELAAALAAARVPHQLVILPLTGHAYDVFWGSFSTQITRRTFELFLDRHVLAAAQPSR